MIMRSQNGDSVVNSNTMVALYCNKNTVYCSINYNADEYGALMGTYNSPAVAKTILRACFDAIKRKEKTFQF